MLWNGCLLFGLASPVSATSVPCLKLDELKPGQQAEVRTVFQGTRIDTFSAEIVGVLRGGPVAGDMIVARATSERVARLGVAQGMSGSPVYVDGKLVGALSSGWPFVKEPLFGVTPIEEMLEVLELSESPRGKTPGLSGTEAGGLFASPVGSKAWGEFRWTPEGSTDVQPGATSAGSDLSGMDLRPAPLPLTCIGLHPRALEAARTFFSAAGFYPVPGGRAPHGGPPGESLVPGAAVAVDLLRGDLQLSAIGTVTYREGDRLLAFGHPFFQSGEVLLPISTVEITTIVPSQSFSFKLGMPGRPAGTLTQDRRPAIAGRLGATPELLPVQVEVRGARTQAQHFHFQAVEDRQLAPQLVALCALNSLLETGGTGGNQTVRWRLRLAHAGLPALTLEDRVAGDGFGGDLLTQLRGPLDFLFNNPFQALDLDTVSVALQLEPGRDQWTLRSAHLDRSAARPGDEVVLRCELEHYRGQTQTRQFRLRLPREIEAGDLMVWVGGGAELMRFEAQRLPGRYRPTSFADAWKRLAAYRSSDGLYAALVDRSVELTSEGLDFAGLPTSAQMVLLSPQNRGDQARPGRIALLAESKQVSGGLTRGEIQLPLTVDPAAP